MSKQQKIQVKVSRDGSQWGEYVTAGEVYTVAPPASRKGQYHFRNERTGGGTFMQPWAFQRAVAAGWITVQAAFTCTPASIAMEHEAEITSIMAGA